jgi:DNA modification methylase
MTLEHWPLDRLVPYARNPRKNDHAVDKVAAAIHEFGFRVPVIAKSDGTVVDGHLRLKAAQKLGLETVPVLLADDMTETQIKAFRISVNRMAELAEWDTELLALELEDLRLDDFDIDLTGFDAGELDALMDEMAGGSGTEGLTDPDDVPEPPVEPVSKPGDVWLLGRHRLMCGDSTDAAQVGILLAGGVADMLWTDPPYGVSYVGKTADALTIENDSLDDVQLTDFLRSAFACAFQHSRAGAAWYVAAPAGPLHQCFSETLKEIGVWRQTLNWVKNTFALGRSDYHYRHEPIFYGWKPGDAHYFVDDRTQDTILEFNKPSRNGEHPTMKPVELIEYCIGNSSKPGWMVLDLFGGSGSTLIACEKTGRINRSMELDPKYCDVIVKRWQEFTGQTATLESTGQPFQA